MSLFTSAFLLVWMIGIDQHWPDADSPITFALFISFIARDIMERSR